MTKLGQLRDAEERARLEIDKAEREAQRIRLSIPDLLQEESRKNTERLREIARQEEEKVSAEIEGLRKELETVSGERIEKLSRKREELAASAAGFLEDYISRGGEDAE